VAGDRHVDGNLPLWSILKNISITLLTDLSRRWLVDDKAEARVGAEWRERIDIRTNDLSRPILSLSGGNQQKALFAKWLLCDPTVLLVDEPTRGVDVAAKAQIHHLIVELAGQGMAVVVVSSEIEEVLGIAHRVLVLRHGRMAGEFPRGTPREEVMAVAFGQEGEQ